MKKEEKDLSVGKRKLKVQSKHFPRVLAYSKLAFFPEIRLAGKWLQDCGFASDQIVTIHHERNKIIITVSDPQ